jgi:hypothetical protein
MPQIKNTGWDSLAIQGKDKPIVLAPRETKDISTDDFESPGVQKSLSDGQAMALSSEEPEVKKSKPKPASNPN